MVKDCLNCGSSFDGKDTICRDCVNSFNRPPDPDPQNWLGGQQCEACGAEFGYYRRDSEPLQTACEPCVKAIKAKLVHEAWLAATLPCGNCDSGRYPKEQAGPARCKECLPHFGKCQHCQKETDLKYGHKRFCSRECKSGFDALIWWEGVPPIYQETDINKLPRQSQSKQILEWDRSTSLYVYGGSGRGKTRTLYLAGRLAIADGHGFEFIRANTLNDMLSDTTVAGRDEFNGWFDDICNVELLAVDEVDKAILNRKCEAKFFELVEYRTSNALATVFISNLNVKALALELKRTGGPLLRRITEFFTPINFDLELNV